jgi:hypothetical protein
MILELGKDLTGLRQVGGVTGPNHHCAPLLSQLVAKTCQVWFRVDRQQGSQAELAALFALDITSQGEVYSAVR